MCQQIQTDKMVAYEQAVKAYQFQVTRYNTWMNYYALFVGALFVSFYMIICYSKSICIICPKHLLIFIAVLGIIASTCWLASLIGNCAWMNNYIKIVKDREKELLGQTSYVYQYIGEYEGNKHCYPGFISTQKMTQWFVGAVLAAWTYILCTLWLKNIHICFIILISILFALGIRVFFRFIQWRIFSGDLKGMILSKNGQKQN